jgi:hypothetical protein
MKAMSDEPTVEPGDVEAEVVDGVPVLVQARAVEPVVAAPPAPLGAVQAAVMTAGGFFAGALAMALVKRVAARRLSALGPVADRLDRLDGLERWPAGTTRTYLVNVRVIARPGE